MRLLVSKLILPVVRAAAGIGVVWGFAADGAYLAVYTGFSLPFLVAPFTLAYLLLLAGDMTYWLTQGRGFRLVLRATRVNAMAHMPRFRRRIAVNMLQSLLHGAALVVILNALLIGVPRTAEVFAQQSGFDWVSTVLPYLTVLEDMVPWALGIGAFFVLTRTLGRAWDALGLAFPIPFRGLWSLASVFFLVSGRGTLSTAYGVDVGAAWPLALEGAMLLYGAASIQRLLPHLAVWFAEGSQRWLTTRRMLAFLSVAGGIAAQFLLLAAPLNVLPAVVTYLTDNDVSKVFGVDLPQVLTSLYDSRFLVAGLVVAAFNLRGLANYGPEGLGRYIPLLETVTLGAAAAAVWFVGAELSHLGRGYQLSGVMAAMGLAAVAIARLAPYGAQVPSRFLADTASWAARSNVRMFALGASLAYYGLFLRPALYQRLSFALMYEWIVVCSIGVVLLLKTSKIVTGDLAVAAPPSAWPVWERHSQRIAQISDTYFSNIANRFRRYVRTGEWREVWAYVLAVLLRNDVTPQAASAVLAPIITHRNKKPGWLWWPGKAKAVRERWELARAELIEEAINAMESLMRRPNGRLRPLQEAAVHDAASRFVQGADAIELSAMLTTSVWQQGARLHDATFAWYWLLLHEDRPRRLYHVGWLKNRLIQGNETRRRELVSQAVGRAFGEVLPPPKDVGLMTRDVSLMGARDAEGEAIAPRLLSGWPVEVLETNSNALGGPMVSHRVRTLNNVEGYVNPRSLELMKSLLRDRYGDATN